MENKPRFNIEAGPASRLLMLEAGENKLRTHLPKFAPLKFTMIFGHDTKRWEVLTQFVPEGGAPLLLSREDLESFPSDPLIAQAMLVA